MACRWIIGAGAALERAHESWCRSFPDSKIEKIPLVQNAQYEFDLEPLNAISPGEGSAFVAFDERFGNFKRVELMQAAMERGFKLASFVSPRAMVAGGVRIGPNAFVGDGAIVGHGSRIDYNCFLLPGVCLGSGVHLRASCWLESAVVVGDGAQIGAHSILRSGALVAAGVQVGRGCELGWPRRYDKDIAAKTVYDPRYDAPIHVYG
ncbi:UDP-3-O-(3-hydroxymyristoyl)glucosamine N-acyltransferase [Delftia acidovorans]|uniref:UDP-3-O-(3-hydroxymyristoyl)glucosamine N-acyltransferase n=1 Tax=Delftia acidovorans TaxID=80866 RepID=UPI000BCDDA54|nr:UDP-3-O-(3-hydroxymyristoyl)glucosamine N-acyltransferase [Delftia acidovorans]SOE39027.1 transferase hexapeptide (six repeat-containing protein) [Delftia acidovorans]